MRKEKIEQKAKSLWYHFCTERTCEGYDSCENCPNSKSHEALLEMAQWKDEQLKEILKKKMDFLYPSIDDYNEGKLAILKDLYQELFNEYYI